MSRDCCNAVARRNRLALCSRYTHSPLCSATMANVLQPNMGFHPRPVSHAPSPFGFGFGLSTSNSPIASPWVAQPGHTNPTAFQQLASSVTQSSKSQKRRLEPDDESENTRPNPRDESMDRSPTPEKPKRAPPKRARIATQSTTVKDDGKERKNAEEEEDNVDIGVLLGKSSICNSDRFLMSTHSASLPPQSLLPILSGLLKTQPGLKKVILPLIPRPSLEDALDALKQSVKKLHEAMPFSNVPSSSLHYTFGMPQQQSSMRNDYVLGRLRPYISEFVSTFLSYFPYFSYKYPTPPPAKNISSSQLNATLHKEKFHPAEAFSFLSSVTKLIIDQPALVISELEPLILPRLTEEWKLWLDNLDRHANREGNMVAPSIARTWEIEVERLGDGKAPGISRLMRDVAKHFPLKQSWGIPSRTLMMIES